MRLAALLVATLVACKSGDAPRPAPKATAGSAIDPWNDDRPKALPPPKVTNPFEHPFVWIVTKDGKTTYLFGTVHGGVDAEHRIPLWVWDFFDHSATLLEEADLQKLDIAKWTVRPEGPTLHQELGDEYWAKLEAMITPVVAGFLDTQATAVAALRVSGYGGSVRDQTAIAMDGELRVRADGLGKKVEFLETGAAQSAMLGELFNLASLKRLLNQRDALKQLNAPFIDAYVDGDETRFAELARAQMRLQAGDDVSTGKLVNRLLLSRNRAWIPAIEQAHAAGGAFVAVGALHLVGEGSVVELLRSRGFTVERATVPSR